MVFTELPQRKEVINYIFPVGIASLVQKHFGRMNQNGCVNLRTKNCTTAYAIRKTEIVITNHGDAQRPTLFRISRISLPPDASVAVWLVKVWKCARGWLSSDSALAGDWMVKGCGCAGENSRLPPHEMLELTASIRHWVTSPSAIMLIIVISGLCIVHGSMGVHRSDRTSSVQ